MCTNIIGKTGGHMVEKTVLIVDDSVITRDMVQKMLEKSGCTVCGIAKDGKEGVEMYESLKPDIVLMDINMPIMDGLEATKRIKEINPYAKIIMLSAISGDDEIVKTLEQIGVAAILKKPIDSFGLRQALEKV